MNQKGFAPVLLVLVLAIVGIAGVVYLKESGKVENLVPPTQKECTLEAKICPDGSSVGRSGPNCEFSECPDTTSANSIPGWKSYSGNTFNYSNSVYSGYSLQYPPTCISDPERSRFFNCKLAHGVYTLIVDRGGHGSGIYEMRKIRDNELKLVPAGEGKITEIENLSNNMVNGTYALNKTPLLQQSPIMIFEFSNIPVQDLKEFEEQLDQILSTFKLIER